MLNIILISLLINTITNFIKGGYPVAFNCGIWAFMGSSSRYFNKDKFNMLGVFNDNRGGDAAGFLAGKNIKHVVGKKYTDLIQDYILPPPKHNIILGHSRKASSGGKVIEYTQPFCYTENNKIIGGAIHNGTLYNELYLKNKYNVPEKFLYNDNEYNPNDTQILSYILMKNKDYSVLSEYKGAAAIIWEDKEKGLGYVFKGASKKYNYYGSSLEEERPLFMYTIEGKGIWFSSIESTLWMIAEEKNPDIKEVPSNQILIIEKGVIIDKIDINRSDSSQLKTYSNNNYNFNCNDNWKVKKNYSNKNTKQLGLNMPIVSNLVKANKDNDLYKFVNEAAKLTYCNDLIQFASGRYYLVDKECNRKLASGIIFLDQIGFETDSKDPESSVYYFLEGIMIKSHIEYQKAAKTLKKIIKGKFIPQECNSKTDISIRKNKFLSNYSIYPITNIKHEYLYTINTLDQKAYTGTFNPLFSYNEYFFTNGKLTMISPCSMNYPEIKDAINKINIYNNFYKTIVKDNYYKLKKDASVVIKYKDNDCHYGVLKSGSLEYIVNESDWEASNESDWDNSLKINNNLKGLTPDEQAWYDESFIDGVILKVNVIMKELDSIESDVIMESNTKSSSKVQSFIDKIRTSITQSELNII